MYRVIGRFKNRVSTSICNATSSRAGSFSALFLGIGSLKRAGVIVLLLVSHSASALDLNWGSATDQTLSDENHYEPQISISSDGTKATAVWRRYDAVLRTDFFQSRSATIDGNIAAWGALTDLSASGTGQNGSGIQIALSSDGTKATAVWVRRNVIQSRSATISGNTATWGAVTEYLSAIGQNANNTQIALSSDGAKATVVWIQSGRYVFSRSATISGNTATWGAVTQYLSVDGQTASDPQIALSSDGTMAVAAWDFYDGSNYIIQSRSATISGNTATWSAVTGLSASGNNALDVQIALSSDGTMASAVWVRRNDGVNYFVQSRSAMISANTAVWGAVTTNLSAGWQGLYDADIALSSDGTLATALWHRYDGSDIIVQSSSATISGNTATWSALVDLSGSGEFASGAQIALSSDGTMATTVWTTTNVVHNRSGTISGNTAVWSAVVTDYSARTVRDPQIALSSDGSISTAVWTTNRSSSDFKFFIQSRSATTNLLNVQIAAASIQEGGAATTATVSRNTDTTSPLTINLASDDTGKATVPASVVIAAGQSTSLQFDINAVDDAIADGTHTVTITAIATAHANGSDTLNVTDNDVATLTLQIAAASVSEADGSSATTATVSRNSGTTSALTVSLASDDTSAATVPASVVIAAGQSTSSAFNIRAINDAIVDGTQAVTITGTATAHIGGSDTLDVTDDDLAAVTVKILAASVGEEDGAAATTATVSRNTDTTRSLSVYLSSNDTGELATPSVVVIAAGQLTSSAFNLNAVDDTIVDGTQSVTINASASAHAGGSDSLNVTDNDVATLTVQVVATSISEAGGAGATFATVSRNTDTTSALTVFLGSSDTSAATLQASVVIAAGQRTSTAFNLVAVDDAIVDGTQSVTITATATGHADGSDTLNVTDNDIAALTVQITAAAVDEGAGAGATSATVSRNTDTTSSLMINLSSNETSELTVPASVVIAAGQSTSATFSINAVDDAVVDGTQTVTLSATAAAHADGSDTLDVTDDDVAELTIVIDDVSISEDDGPIATMATVSRNTDTTSALTVTLASDDTTEAVIAKSIDIAVGQSTSPSFNIDAIQDEIVDGTQTVTFTVTALGHADHTDTLDVADEDVPELSLVIAAESIREDNGLAATTALVSRNTDTTLELIVTLVSDDTTAANVRAMVIIAAGQRSSDPFNIDAIDDDEVDGTQSVTITASATAHADGTDTIDVIDDGEASLYVVPLGDGKVVIFEL